MQAIMPALQKKVIVDDSIKGILQTLPLLPAGTDAEDRALKSWPST